MRHYYTDFMVFAGYFFQYAYYLRGVLVSLLVLIFLCAVAISHFEGLPLGESLYFAFITGMSIGYGDISPVTAWGRVVSVAIGIIGMLTTGMTIAIATRALATTVKDLQAKDLQSE
jgi:hypothetical protein